MPRDAHAGSQGSQCYVADVGEVLEVDPFANGKWTLAFDGRVFEIFGPILVGGGVNWTTVADSWRIHINNLLVQVKGPDRHGFHEVAFGSQVNQHTQDGIPPFVELNDAQFARFRPLFDALGAAGVSIG